MTTETETVTATVKAQYEAYPYPERNPDDEKKRLIIGSPGALAQIRHFVFAGRFPNRRLRFLAAGGGSGDGAVMMAQQASDLGLDIEIVHLDLAAATQEIARQRIARRGLNNVVFIQDSLLNAAAYGPFDYIDCCGVLHHLANPAQGLAALVQALSPEGGMGLMVYATLGRTGVYPLQAALRQLTAQESDPARKVKLAKRLLADLPEGNWLKRNPFITDHQVSDAGLYDLLLHSTDRSYTVGELAGLVEHCGLSIISFIEKYRYDPSRYITAPELLAVLPQDPLARAALAENLCGSLTKHIVYVTHGTRADHAEATLCPQSIPLADGLDLPHLADRLKPGQPLTGTLGPQKFSLPLPRLAPAILRRINGQQSWQQIHASLQTSLGHDAPDWQTFWAQAQEIWAQLHSINALFLLRPAQE